MDFIKPAPYSMKEVKNLALLSRKTIEKGGNMIRMSGEIMFAYEKVLIIGNRDVKVCVSNTIPIKIRGKEWHSISPSGTWLISLL